MHTSRPSPDSYTDPAMPGRTPSSDAPPFGRRLAALRKERGLSQARLAELLDTSRGMIDYYERRATNPSLDFIKRAADVLGVPAARLIDDVAEPARRGPTPRLQERFERIRRLPRSRQDFILRFLDTYLDGVGKSG